VVLFYLLYFILFEPGFQTADDAEMSLVVQGKVITDQPDSRLQFTHVIIGDTLVALNGVAPSVNWYGIYLLTCHVISMLAISFVAFSKNAITTSRIAFLIYLATVEIYCLNNLQFTTTASLSGMAGVLLMFRADEYERKWLLSTVGAVLVLLSSMIRVHSLFMVLVIGSPFLVAEMFRHYRNRNLSIIAPVATCVVLILAARSYQAYRVESDRDWSKAIEHQRSIARLINGNLLPYTTENEGYYKAVGWTNAEYELFMWHVYCDDEVYSISRFEHLNAKANDRWSIRPFRFVAGTIGTLAMTMRRPVLVVAVAGALVLLACSGKGNRFVVLSTLALSFPLTFSLKEINYRCPDWVQIPILTNALLLAVVSYGRPIRGCDRSVEERTSSQMKWLWISAVCVSLVMIAIHHGENSHQRRSRELIVEDFQRLGEKKYSVVVTPTVFPISALPVIASSDALGNVNMLYFGTGQTFPWAPCIEDARGLRSLLEVFERPGTYLAIPNGFGEFANVIANHLRQRTGREVSIHPVWRGHRVFSVRLDIESRDVVE
jgi:hypothetical protein